MAVSAEKKAEQKKNMIMDWCKEDNIKCEEIKNDSFFWQLSIGEPPLAAYCQKRFPDRINFQKQITLAEEHELIVNDKWDANKQNEVFFNLEYETLSCGALHEPIIEKQRIKGMRLYTTQVGNIEKNDFVNNFLKMSQIGIHILGVLNTELGISMADSRDTSTNSESTTPGIG